jgi:hypothetical protein
MRKKVRTAAAETTVGTLRQRLDARVADALANANQPESRLEVMVLLYEGGKNLASMAEAMRAKALIVQ